MGNGDITRSIFDRGKHYSAVNMQQGRVVIDDDWNEEGRIAREDLQQSRLHIIGPHGSPDMGFKITGAEITDDGLIDFKILAGTFYLGGLRVELEDSEPYRDQSDWLNQPEQISPSPEGERFDFVFLEVWEQPVSAVEDSELFEVALGGADTSGRTKIMQRVRILPDVGTDDCAEAWQTAQKIWQGKGQGVLNAACEVLSGSRLSVGYEGSAQEGNLCNPSVAGGYLGAENQTLRVELVDDRHLVWGFNNGSSLYRAEVSGTTVRLLTEPKDQTQWPQKHHIVEILPWSARLPNGEKAAELRGHFSRIGKPYDPDIGTFEIETPIDSDLLVPDLGDYFYLRIWERDRFADEPLYEFEPNVPVTLGNTGVNVTISREGNLDFLPGDHWVIALRPETPRTVVPWSLEKAKKPNGYRRYRAPLALIHWKPGDDPLVYDCRRRFRPLTRLECCCSIRVGDGVHSFGDCDDLQMAIDSLPRSGGEICLLKGIHTANARIEGRRNILIGGCGTHTIVIPHQDQLEDPIIQIIDSECITLKGMELDSLGGTAIYVVHTGNGEIPVRNISICQNRIIGYRSGILVQGGTNFTIRQNTIRILDRTNGGVGIFLSAEDALIEGNDIGVVPAEATPAEEPPGGKPADPTDPCVKLPDIYLIFPKYYLYIAHLWMFPFLILPTNPYRALGGVQVAAGSEQVRIRDNRIRGGAGNGVTLGGHPFNKIPTKPDDESSPVEPVEFSEAKVPIRGQVVSNDSGDPLPGITIELNNVDTGVSVSAVSLNDGAFDTSEQQKRTWNVSILSSNYKIHHWEKQTDVGPDGQELLVIYLTEIPAEEEDDLAFLYDISIYNNEISGVAKSGIASGWVLDFEKKPINPLYAIYNSSSPISGLSIASNSITNCLSAISSGVTTRLSMLLGRGGISLGICENVSIASNRIVRNGYDNRYPVCGIFVGCGERIEIANNTIEENAPGEIADVSDIDASYLRGGIVGFFAPTTSMAVNVRKIPSTDFAVRIHDNVIRQPVGPALSLVGFGPVSVCQNHLESEIPSGPRGLEFLATAVLLINLDPLSGDVLFNGNRIRLGRGRSIAGAIIAASSDLGFDGNCCEALNDGIPFFGRGTVSVMCNTVAISGKTLRVTDNRFKESASSDQNIKYSLISFSINRNITSNNQGDHCILSFSWPILVGEETPYGIEDYLVTSGNQVIDRQYCESLLDLVNYPATEMHTYYMWTEG